MTQHLGKQSEAPWQTTVIEGALLMTYLSLPSRPQCNSGAWHEFNSLIITAITVTGDSRWVDWAFMLWGAKRMHNLNDRGTKVVSSLCYIFIITFSIGKTYNSYEDSWKCREGRKTCMIPVVFVGILLVIIWICVMYKKEIDSVYCHGHAQARLPLESWVRKNHKKWFIRTKNNCDWIVL